MTETLIPTEAEAAELEGIIAMPEDLIPLREEKVILDEEIDRLQARKKEIQDIFGERLEADGAVGYLLNGKVHARLVTQMRSTVDSKKLREQFQHIWKKVLKTQEVHSVRVN